MHANIEPTMHCIVTSATHQSKTRTAEEVAPTQLTKQVQAFVCLSVSISVYKSAPITDLIGSLFHIMLYGAKSVRHHSMIWRICCTAPYCHTTLFLTKTFSCRLIPQTMQLVVCWINEMTMVKIAPWPSTVEGINPGTVTQYWPLCPCLVGPIEGYQLWPQPMEAISPNLWVFKWFRGLETTMQMWAPCHKMQQTTLAQKEPGLWYIVEDQALCV